MTKLVSLPLTDDLVDEYVNLTAGNLIRRSDATYVNTSGVLSYSRGTRTNLWTRSDPSVDTGLTLTQTTAGAYSWPAGGLSGAITFGDNSVTRTVYFLAPLTTGVTYIISCYVLMDDGSAPVPGESTSGYDFRLTGTGGAYPSLASYTVTHIGSNVYRVSAYTTSTITGNANQGVAKVTGNSSKGFKVSGFQLEALPSGNVIGSDLMDQEQLGSELVANGTFTDTTSTDSSVAPLTGWSNFGTHNASNKFTISGGQCTIISDGTSVGVTNTGSMTAGKIYYFSFTMTAVSGGIKFINLIGGSAVGNYNSSNSTEIIFTTSGSKYFYIKAETGGTTIQISRSSGTCNVTIDNVSVKEVTSPAKGAFHGTAMLAGSTELITNGGFETVTGTADDGTTDSFTGWTITTGGTSYADSTATAYLGSKALKIYRGDTYTQLQSSDYAATANKLYKLEFYTRGDGTYAGRYKVVNQASTDMFPITSTGITGTSYTKVTKYFYTTAATTAIAVLLVSSTDASSTVYFDYVSVRQVQTTWTKQGTETIEIDESVGTGGLLKVTGGDSAYGPYLALANANDMTDDLTVGETYQLSFNAYVASGDTVSVVAAASDHTALASVSVTPTSSTAYTLYFKATHATTNRLEFLSLDSGDIIYLDSVTIKSVPDLAYLSPGTYTATSGSTATIPAEHRIGLAPDGLQALMVEGEATNLITYSQDAGYVAGFRLTETSGQTDPMGGTNAILYTETADNGTHYISTNGAFPAYETIADNTTVTFSFFIKKGTTSRDWFGVDFVTKSAAEKFFWFNLTTLAAGTTTSGYTGQIISLGNGWYRISITGSVGSGTTKPYAFLLCGTADNTSSYAGDVNYSLYIFGLQYEATAYPTSYIPTNGCPVTRLTEAGSTTNGYSWTIGSALSTALGVKGTMLVDITPGHSAAGGSGAAVGRVSVSDTAASLLYYNYTNTRFEAADGTNTPNYTLSIVANTPYTKAVRWDETANGGAGYLQLAYKSAGTWYTATAGSQRTAFDGAFTIGATTKLRLGIGSEYPFWIKNIRFVDYFALDAPAAFTFTDVTGAFLSTVYTSNVITNTSIDAVISIVGGTYSINGGAYTAAAGIIGPDDTVTVRVTSSANPLTAVSAVLTIGAQSDTFTVTTMSVGAGFLQGMRMVLGGFAPSEKVN